jgi:hypothetical protein
MAYEQIRDELAACVQRGSIRNTMYKDLNSAIQYGSEREMRSYEAQFDRAFPEGHWRGVWIDWFLFGGGAFELVKRWKKPPPTSVPNGDPRIMELLNAIHQVYGRWVPLAQQLLSLKATIVKGREPRTTPSIYERTLDHTGTCGICERNIKMRGKVLVGHGYTKPLGWRQNNDCFGTGYEPIETSPQVLLDYAENCRNYLTSLPAKIENLKKLSQEANALVTPENRNLMDTLNRDQRKRAIQLSRELTLCREALKQLPAEIEMFMERAKHWRAMPLPS